MPPRFKVLWFGRQLAIIYAETADSAIAKLLEERGYTYLTAEVLRAERVNIRAALDRICPEEPAGERG